MRILFIRHGDPDYANDTLTEKGKKEAALLSDRVIKWNVKKFYCSPLGRAKDTAEYSLKRLNREAEVCDWLQEFYYPIKDPVTGNNRIAWDFMPSYWTEIAEMYDKDNWMNTAVLSTGEIAEKAQMVYSGIDGILAENGYVRHKNYYKAKKPNTDTIVIFSHLGVSFVMLSHLLGISAPVLWQQFFIAPTSVTEVCTEEREKGAATFRVKKFGDVSHLYVGGEKPSDSGFFNEIY
jgi:probable phosphoglycerate mutase